MAQLDIIGDEIVLTLDAVATVLSFRHEVHVKLSQVSQAQVLDGEATAALVDEVVFTPSYHIGGALPGVGAAGHIHIFTHQGNFFLDVRSGEPAVALSLTNGDYDQVVVRVDDPQAVATQVNQALATRH